MLYLGLRFGLSTIPRVLMLIISLYELVIVLRVIMNLLYRAGIIVQRNGFTEFLHVVTEPVLRPIRQTIMRLTGFSSIDLSPAVAIIIGELLQWLIKIIF